VLIMSEDSNMADATKEPERGTEDAQSGNRQWHPAPTDSSTLDEDLDCKVYGYSNVSPTDVLDLHCKAVLGIEKGVVPLPKYKTLKLGCQIQGTNLYLTMLYSRDLLWVPGDGFKAGPPSGGGAETVDKDTDSDGETKCAAGTESKSEPSRSAPTPRKRAPPSTRSAAHAAKGRDAMESKGKEKKSQDGKGKAPSRPMAGEHTYTTDHWLNFSGQAPLTISTSFDASLAAKAKETAFDRSP
jgi:hypothetical protein